MAEKNFKETEDKKVDEDCDVKDGVAKERFGFIKHPIRTIKKSKEDHPVAWAVGTIGVVFGGLVVTYALGRYSADQTVFEPDAVEPEIPDATPAIEIDPDAPSVDEISVEETAPEVVETK